MKVDTIKQRATIKKYVPLPQGRLCACGALFYYQEAWIAHEKSCPEAEKKRKTEKRKKPRKEEFVGISVKLTEEEAPYDEFAREDSWDRRIKTGHVGELLAKKALEARELWVVRGFDLCALFTVEEEYATATLIDERHRRYPVDYATYLKNFWKVKCDLIVLPADWAPLRKDGMPVIDWRKIFHVEVKSSLGKFPPHARRHFSYSQWVDSQWDALVRVKVLSPTEGEVHPDDVNYVVSTLQRRSRRWKPSKNDDGS